MAPRNQVPSAFALQKVWAAVEVATAYLKPIYHVVFIPAVIVFGLTCTSPRPQLVQLLSPM